MAHIVAKGMLVYSLSCCLQRSVLRHVNQPVANTRPGPQVDDPVCSLICFSTLPFISFRPSFVLHAPPSFIPLEYYIYQNLASTMSPANNIALVQAGIIAVSAAVAAAVAFYESPHVQRHADHVRRRVAHALHQLGDGINPAPRQPLFNRPEDAYAYWATNGQPVPTEPPTVDADEETRRRQREELMYWNAVREKRQQERKAAGVTATAGGADGTSTTPSPARGPPSDSYSAAEIGARVFNSGAEVWGQNNGLVHRRGGDDPWAVDSTAPTNPFANNLNSSIRCSATGRLSSADKRADNIDMYSATTSDTENYLRQHPQARVGDKTAAFPAATVRNETPLGDHDDVANIQAWYQPSFYSPLPMTPSVPASDPSISSSWTLGMNTPTDSASHAGSGEDVADDVSADDHDNEDRSSDVSSMSEGIMTPSGWSEVDSIVSEEQENNQDWPY